MCFLSVESKEEEDRQRQAGGLGGGAGIKAAGAEGGWTSPERGGGQGGVGGRPRGETKGGGTDLGTPGSVSIRHTRPVVHSDVKY